MLVADTFVAEDPTDFVDLRNVSANDALKIEFEGNTELHFNVVGVEVRHEGPGGGSSGFHLKDRSFDF